MAFYRQLKVKGVKRFLRENILGSNDTPNKKAWSVALGIAIGFTPFYGFQSLLVLFLARVFKLNSMIALTTSYISIPPLIPFIVYASLTTGYWILGYETSLTLAAILDGVDVWQHITFYLIGSFVLSLVSSSMLGLATYFWLTHLESKKTI